MKKIINVINDDIYTILEFEDHTILPLISVENFINKIIEKNIMDDLQLIDSSIVKETKECIYCHRSNIKLCTLDDKHYICLECTQKIIENFAQLGSVINLNLKNFNPQLIRTLKDFIQGNVQVKHANLMIKSLESNVSQVKKEK